tara:strand:+ start:172 stop:552 length:381 start_codon:yes stop_codon:yes gene_type:complete
MKFLQKYLVYFWNTLIQFALIFIKSESAFIERTARNIANKFVKSTKNTIDDKALEIFWKHWELKTIKLPTISAIKIAKKINKMNTGPVKALKINTKEGLQIGIGPTKISWNPKDGSASFSFSKKIK